MTPLPAHAAANSRPIIWAILAVAVGTQTAGSIVAQGVYILVPFWRDAFGTSLASASLAVTAMNAAQIATMVALGRAIDRHGERLVVALAMLGMAASTAAAALFADGLSGLLIAMAALGGSYAAVQPGGTRAILRWFPPEHRSLATGFRQGAVPFGTMAAAALLPYLAAVHGWRSALWAATIMSLLGAALFGLLYREPDQAAGSAERPLALKPLLRAVGADPSFWPVLRLGIAMSAFQFTVTAHLIGYLAEGLGYGLAWAAGLFAGLQAVGIPARVLLAFACDRLFPGRRVACFAVIALFAAGSAALLALLPAGTPMPVVVAALAVLGLFGIGWFPLYLLLIAESAPRSSIASTVAFATTLCMVAMAAGPFLFGLMTDHAGYGATWTALILPVCVLAAALLRRRSRVPVG